MAETALAVLPLLNNAVDWFRYIRIAKNFDRDFPACQYRLTLGAVQLSCWCKIFPLDPSNNSVLKTFNEAERKAVSEVFKEIEDLFKTATKTSVGSSEPLENLDSLCTRLQDLTTRRSPKGLKMLSKKTTWAIYKRDEFNHLIDSFEKLLDRLTSLFPEEEVKKIMRGLSEEEAREVKNEDKQALDTLEKIAKEHDTCLGDALEKATAAGSPTIHQNTVTFSGRDKNSGLQLGQNYGTMTNTFGRSGK